MAVLFLFLAIYETLTQKRPLVAGLLLGAAFWSRQPTIMTLPFFVIMFSDQWLPEASGSADASLLARIRLKPLLLLGAGVGAFILLSFAYNYARFGTPLDASQNFRPDDILKERWFNHGPFHPSYVTRHTEVIFQKLPVIQSEAPYVRPSWSGMAIWATTPAFVYALFAGLRSKLAIACWAAIIPTALTVAIFAGTGFAQFGYRYAQDFYPFLFLLTIIGIGGVLRWHHKLLIVASVLVNFWGVLWIYNFDAHGFLDLRWVGYG